MVSSILWRIDEAKSEFMRFNRCLNLVLKEYIYVPVRYKTSSFVSMNRQTSLFNDL